MPIARKQYHEKASELNIEISRSKPYTISLYESIIAYKKIRKLKITQANRICIVILDSTVEIACKEYLVNETNDGISDERLKDIFKRRQAVHSEIQRRANLDQSLISKINYLYRARCDLIHQRSNLTVSDDNVNDFFDSTKTLLEKLFNLNFP